MTITKGNNRILLDLLGLSASVLRMSTVCIYLLCTFSILKGYSDYNRNSSIWHGEFKMGYILKYIMYFYFYPKVFLPLYIQFPVFFLFISFNLKSFLSNCNYIFSRSVDFPSYHSALSHRFVPREKKERRWWWVEKGVHCTWTCYPFCISLCCLLYLYTGSHTISYFV